MKRTLIALIGTALLTGCSGTGENPKEEKNVSFPKSTSKEELSSLVAQYSVKNKDVEEWKIRATVIKKGCDGDFTVRYYFNKAREEDSLTVTYNANTHSIGQFHDFHDLDVVDDGADGIIDLVIMKHIIITRYTNQKWINHSTFQGDINQVVNHAQKVYDVYRTLLDVEKHRPKKVPPTPAELPFGVISQRSNPQHLR